MQRVLFLKALCFGFLCATEAFAQNAPIDRWSLTITGAASSQYDYTVATCNLDPPTSVATVNPYVLVWDDPDRAGRVCEHDTSTNGGVLFALPIGNYSATLQAGNTVGYSPASNAAQFSRVAPPQAPTNFLLLQRPGQGGNTTGSVGALPQRRGGGQ